MKYGDTNGAGVRALEHRGCSSDLRGLESTPLVEPRSDGVEADHREFVGGVLGLCWPDDVLPFGESRPEAGRERIRDVVIPRNREHWHLETLQERPSLLELASPASMREITGYDEKLRVETLTQVVQCRVCLGHFVTTDMEIGYMNDPADHGARLIHAKDGRRENRSSSPSRASRHESTAIPKPEKHYQVAGGLLEIRNIHAFPRPAPHVTRRSSND